jgi:hypothetical protein
MAGRNGTSTNVLHRWVCEFREVPGNTFPGQGQLRWSQSRAAELECKIGRQMVEIDLLKGSLAAYRREADPEGVK